LRKWSASDAQGATTIRSCRRPPPPIASCGSTHDIKLRMDFGPRGHDQGPKSAGAKFALTRGCPQSGDVPMSPFISMGIFTAAGRHSSLV
jgi:hypothetical protein